MELQKPGTDHKGSGLGPQHLVLLTLAIVVISLWLLLTPGGLLGKSDAIGYAVCHRIDLRSFHLGERTLPLCSRCTGMYLGALFTLLAFVVFRGKAGSYPPKQIQYVLIGFAGLWVLDGVNSFLSLLPSVPQLYPSQNWLRLATGTLLGVSLMTMIYPVFIQTAWHSWGSSAIIPSWKWLFGLMGFLVLIDLGVLSENPLILYPLALFSSLGVLALLTLAYSVLALTFFRRQNSIVSVRELWFPLLGGLTLALTQVAIIDLLRYVLTGTWDGFHL
jgi:uncharacterized membrane protein